jgi:hypothetical protein
VRADPGYAHCPNCLAEYRAGFTICTECGSLLVPGASPARAGEDGDPIRPGAVEVVRAGEREADRDRFALEETPVVLTVMAVEDTEEFLSALEEQEIGARRGHASDDGGVEIVVHAANLMDAQAVLVEFTGDVSLLDDIAVDPDAIEDDWAVVTWVSLRDAGFQANRLRERGLDVRMELPAETEDASGAQAAILVAPGDLDAARRILGIEL